GGSGPPARPCLPPAGGSYRWVYVPTIAGGIRNLKVPVGDKGETNIYAALDIAKPKNVAHMGVKALYSLVEVEINNGQGSPKNDSFVATSFKVLDGTKDYPLVVAEVVKQLKDRYAAHLKEQQQAIDAALLEAQKKALKDAKPTGPREQSELMYLTWLPGTKTLRAHFCSKISDGAYTYVQGGPGPIGLPPGKGKLRP